MHSYHPSPERLNGLNSGDELPVVTPTILLKEINPAQSIYSPRSL
jgi:hypothetical protein